MKGEKTERNGTKEEEAKEERQENQGESQDVRQQWPNSTKYVEIR